MARRYPGSLVARFLVNRFYALRRKYAKPSSKPGRFDFIGHWFLNWEGLLIGGVFVGGLGFTAINIYIEERLDDIARRAERCQLYDSSCVMEASHLASVQSSLALFKVLKEVAAQRSSWHQHCRHTHQHYTQLAADDVKAWRIRAARCQPQTQQATADGLAPAPAGNTRGEEGPSVVWGLCSCDTSGTNAEGASESILQEPDQPAAALCGLSQQAQQAASTKHQQDEEEQEGEGEEEKQQQQQSECAHHQRCTTSVCVSRSSQTQQQQDEGRGNAQKQELFQEPSQQLNNDQQQQQQQPSFWLRPAHWYCCMRLRHAEEYLLKQQRGLHLSESGLHMWQQLGQHAAQQVELLEGQQQQHMLMLMAHAAQRARWHQLTTYTTQLELWFELPTIASISSLISTLTGILSGTRSDGSPEQHATATAAATHAAHQHGSGCEAGAAGQEPPADQQEQKFKGSPKRWLGAGLGWFGSLNRKPSLPTGEPLTAAADKRAPAITSTTSTTTAAPCAPEPHNTWQHQAAEVETGRQETSSQTGPLQGTSWLRVRLLLPHWIPAEIEDQDEALLCNSPYTAVNRSSTEPHQEQQQQQPALLASRGDLGGATPSDKQQHNAQGILTACSRQRATKGCTGQISSGSSSSSGSSNMADAASQPLVPEATAQDICGGDGSSNGGGWQMEQDDGGVLAELFDEALDVVEALWDAAA